MYIRSAVRSSRLIRRFPHRVSLAITLLGVSGCRWGYELLSDDAFAGGGTGSSSGTSASGGTGGDDNGASSTASGVPGTDGGETSDTGGTSGGGTETAGTTAGGTEMAGTSAGGSDTGGSSSGGGGGSAGSGGMPGILSLAPTPRFTVTPGAREPGQSFALDASASSDSEDAAGALSYAWDFENNGSFDASGTTTSHSFATAGIYTITLQVTDTSGASARLSKVVAVAPASGLVIVDTNSTTLTAGATPGMPGPDGLLSLREALAYVNATASRQVILVRAGLTIPLTTPITLSDAAGDALVGYGATIDGSGLTASSPCMEASSPGGLVAGLAFSACPSRGVEVFANNVTVANCAVSGANAGLFVNGSLTGVTLGPGNDVSNIAGYGIHLSGPANVFGNRVADTGSTNILILGGASGSSISQNQLLRPGQFNIDLANQVTNLSILHNVLHGSSVHAVGAGSTSGATFDSNVVTGATNWGIPIDPSGFTSLTNNLFFGNGSGGCKCTLDASNKQVDPLYVDAGSDDYRPSLISPLLDAGKTTTFDTNGVAPGSFNGLAPDIGYYEAPSN